MEETKIVLDASIIVKWFLKELYSEEAIRIRNDYVQRKISIAIPSLLIYEVLNALKYSGVYSEEELKEICSALNKYGFEIHDLEEDLKDKAITITYKYNVTVYDASYIALAMKLKTVLYTADNELLERFPKVARHVKEYS
ncbi:MAG: PIN domain nuclease [Thermoprotei archaeon]|nr:MAG: PIN domain nuclease [Thermoprotei archaeon]